MSDDSAGEFDELAWAGCFHGEEKGMNNAFPSKEDITRSKTNDHLDRMELHALKRRAKDVYLEATDTDHLDCGSAFADYLNPERAALRGTFNRIWARVMELDPLAPPSPFDEEEEG